MNKYEKPAIIPDDMGKYGGGGGMDERLQAVFELLEYVPKDISTILDVGYGNGQISDFFFKNGKLVTGIGLEIESYGIDLDQEQKKGVRLLSCDVVDMPFENESFSAVVASHVLEHLPNIGIALKEIRRVLCQNGWLLVFLPKYSKYVCSGHINGGWNLGQLMYVLLLNGFNVKEGHFIEYGYNICAYVRKSENKIPALRGDRGDIHILNENGLWPVPITAINGIADVFNGDILSINWENAESLLARRTKNTWKTKIVNFLVIIIRKIVGGNVCASIGHLMINNKKIINPKKL